MNSSSRHQLAHLADFFLTCPWIVHKQFVLVDSLQGRLGCNGLVFSRSSGGSVVLDDGRWLIFGSKPSHATADLFDGETFVVGKC